LQFFEPKSYICTLICSSYETIVSTKLLSQIEFKIKSSHPEAGAGKG